MKSKLKSMLWDWVYKRISFTEQDEDCIDALMSYVKVPFTGSWTASHIAFEKRWKECAIVHLKGLGFWTVLYRVIKGGKNDY